MARPKLTLPAWKRHSTCPVLCRFASLALAALQPASLDTRSDRLLRVPHTHHNSRRLSSRCPICITSQSAPHLATWLCKKHLDCRRLPSLSTILLVPQFAFLFFGFCFESIVALTCTLAKAESVCPRVAENASPQTLRR